MDGLITFLADNFNIFIYSFPITIFFVFILSLAMYFFFRWRFREYRETSAETVKETDLHRSQRLSNLKSMMLMLMMDENMSGKRAEIEEIARRITDKDLETANDVSDSEIEIIEKRIYAIIGEDPREMMP